MTTSAQPIFELANFPDYVFTEDGVPHRKSPPRRGPRPQTAQVKPFRRADGSIAYKLYDSNGKRSTVTAKSIAAAIDFQEFGFSEYFDLPNYPTYVADRNGTVYRTLKSGMVRQLRADLNARSERFVVYDKHNQRRTLTRFAVLRMIQPALNSLDTVYR